jgi:hypothetical protein
MKMKTQFLLFAAYLCATISTTGQITIDQNDMPNVGDTIRQSTTLNLAGINYAQSGNDITWDFTTLVPLSQSVDTFVSVSSTPWIYQLVFIYPIVATIASPMHELEQIPTVPVTDAFEYYKESSSSFSFVGYAATINAIPLPIKFNSPDVIYKFPLDIGSSDSSLADYNIGLPGIGYISGWKKRVNLADGWGTLKTPYGSFPVLRVRSDIVQYDSLYLDTLGQGMHFLREYTEYKWLGKNHGLPLCTVTEEGPTTTINYIDSARNLLTGIHAGPSYQKEIHIFPNPAGRSFTLEYYQERPGDVHVDIITLQGEVKYHASVRNLPGSNRICLQAYECGLTSGLYFARVTGQGDTHVAKLVIR